MLSIAKTSKNGKRNPLTEDSLVGMAGAMEQWILSAAEQGLGFHEFESAWHEMVYRLANLGTGLFISQQGDGDLGESVVTDDGVVLQRSAEPVNRPLQTVFGLFQVRAYVYARGPKKRIELRPVDARMQLPPGYASYLFEEFSQCFCVEQAFDHSLDGISRVMRQTLSKETLERINQRVGWQAEQYLDELVAPAAEEEGELMILTGDGKGVRVGSGHGSRTSVQICKLSVRAAITGTPAHRGPAPNRRNWSLGGIRLPRRPSSRPAFHRSQRASTRQQRLWVNGALSRDTAAIDSILTARGSSVWFSCTGRSADR